jgi:hypothetical protein
LRGGPPEINSCDHGAVRLDKHHRRRNPSLHGWHALLSAVHDVMLPQPNASAVPRHGR